LFGSCIIHILNTGVLKLKKKKSGAKGLNCGTGSSDISGYHADFHEGHGTVGAGQGNGMGVACYV
jgi:hypothetical protein